MAKFRIVIEIETASTRGSVNRLAMEMKDLAVTSWSNPVYVATEEVDTEKQLLYQTDED